MLVLLRSIAKRLEYHVYQGDRAGPGPVKMLDGLLKGVRLNLDLRMQSSYWAGTHDNWILRRVPLSLLVGKGRTVWDDAHCPERSVGRPLVKSAASVRMSDG